MNAMITIAELLLAKGQGWPSWPPEPATGRRFCDLHFLSGAYQAGQPIHCVQCGFQLGQASQAAAVPPSRVFVRSGIISQKRPPGVRFAVPCLPKANLKN